MTAGCVLLSRVLLIALFLPFSALDKVLNFGAAVEQASQAVSVRWLARGLIVAGFTMELILSIAILSGVADRLAAMVMAGYCVLTALLWKQFWKMPDFRLRGPSPARSVFWDFLKNLSLAGGFLLLAIGGNGAGVQSLIDHPGGSTCPYPGRIPDCDRP